MRKDVLVSLLAASTPMVALADANVTTEIKTDKWTGAEDLTVDNLLLTSPTGATVTQEIKNLVSGKYKLTIGSTADNVKIGDKKVNAGDVLDLTVADGKTSLNLTIEAQDAENSWKLEISKLEFVFDFVDVHDKLQYKLSVLVEAIGGLSEDDKDKTSLLEEATKIAADISKIKDETLDVYKEFNLAAGAEGCFIAEDIAGLQTMFDNVKGSSAAYFAALEAIKAWDAPLAAVTANFNAANPYTKKNLQATLDAINADIKAYAEKLEADYKATSTGASNTFATDYSAANVQKSIKGITDRIAALESQIVDYNLNDNAYNEVDSLITVAKDAHNKALNAIIAELVDTPDVYEDSRNAAQKELNDQLMEIVNAEKANVHDAAYGEDGATQAANTAKVNAAITEIANIQTKYIDAAKADKAAYAAANVQYNKLVRNFNSAKSYIANVLNDTEAKLQVDVDALNARITTLQTTIKVKNEDHSLNEYDYTTESATIQTLITELRAKATPYVNNYKSNGNISTLIGELSATLEEATKTINALVSEDGNYKADGKYAKSIENFTKTIDGYITSLKADFEKHLADDNEATYNTNIAATSAKIAKLVADAEAALAAYETYIKEITADKAEYDKLYELVTNPEVTGTDGVTYEQKLSDVATAIEAVNNQLTAANKKTDAAHVTAMLALATEAAKTTISDNIAALTSSYAGDKAAYDNAVIELAVNKMMVEVTNQVTIAENTLADATANWTKPELGNSYDKIINTDLKDLKVRLAAEKAKTSLDGYVMPQDGAKALALLGEVKAAIDKINADFTALNTEVQKVIDAVDENNRYKDDADDLSALYNVKINGGKLDGKTYEAIADQYADTAADTVSAYNSAIAALNATLTALNSEVATSYDAETLVKDWADTPAVDEDSEPTPGFGSRFDTLEKSIKALIAKAALTKENFLAKEEVAKAYDEAGTNKEGFAKLIENANAAAASATSPADNYYENEVKKYQREVSRIQSRYLNNYANQEFVGETSQKQNRLNEITNVVKNLEAVAGLVEANETNHNAQLERVAAEQKYWQDVYYHISTTDETSKQDSLLTELASLQIELNTINDAIANSFANGKSDANNDTHIAALAALNAKVKNLSDAQSENYNAVMAADNLKRHNDFLDAAKAANEAYNNAVNYINEYLEIEDAAIKASVDQALATHKLIYEFATQITQLKEKELLAYNATEPGKLFDFEETFKADAVEIYNGIQEKFNLFADAVNDNAAQRHSAVKDMVSGEYDAAIAALTGYQEEVVDGAFSDIKALKNSLGSLKRNDKPATAETPAIYDYEYACNVDELIISEEELKQMVAAGKAAVAAAEWAVINKAASDTYEKQIADIKSFVYVASEANNTYLKDYEDKVAKTLTAAQTLAAESADLYADMPAIHALINEFNDDVDGALAEYNKAANASAKNETNLANYDYLMKEFAWANDSLDDVIDFVDNYCFENSDVDTKLDNVEGQLDAYEADAEEDKLTGALATNLNNYIGMIALQKSAIDGIYTAANNAEYMKLIVEVQVLKSDYNNAIATVDVNDAEAIAKVEAYNEIINTILADIEAAKKAIDTPADPEKPLTNSEIQEAYLKLEARMAAVRYELSENYIQPGQTAAIVAEINNTIEAQRQRQAAAVAEVTKLEGDTQFDAELADWLEDIDAFAAYVQTYIADNSVIFYEEKLDAAVAALAGDASYANLETRIAAAVKKYEAHKAAYAALSGELTELQNAFTAAQNEINAYAYTVNNPLEDSQKYLDIQGWLEEDAKFLANATDLDENSELANAQDIKDAIKELRITYANAEYSSLINTLNSLASWLYNESRVSGTYKYTQSAKDIARSDAYYNVYFNSGNLNTYLGEASTESTKYKDTDLNVFTDDEGNTIYESIDFMDGENEGLVLVKARYEELKAVYEAAYEKVMSGRYRVGDAAYVEGENGAHVRDGKVLVNDYEQVLEYLLNDKVYSHDFVDSTVEYDIAGEIDFETADVARDYEINIGDVTAAAQLVQGKSLTASIAALRMAPAKSNDAIAYNIVTEGNRQYVEISLLNSRTYVGGQMDIQLPENVTLLTASLGDRAFGHNLRSSDLGNGMHRLVISSISTNEIADLADNTILRIEVIGNAAGMAITNVKFADENARLYNINGTGADGTTGINGVTTVDTLKSKIYSVGGKMMNAIKKGVNIIRNSDGSTKKVVNK